MQINEKRLERAKETLERLKARKVGEINEAQTIFCASLKCYIITNEDEMAERAYHFLINVLKMEPEMILKTMKSITLTEEYIATTLMWLRHRKLIEQVFRNLSVN
jgi:hypothetical protein